MWKKLSLVIGGVVSIASVAVADAGGSGGADGGARPVVEQLLDIMRAGGQIDDQQYDALLAQAREERAAAAVAGAGPSCAAGQAAEPNELTGSEKPAVKVSTGWSGLKLQSGDGAFAFQLGGRLQTDFAVFDQDVSPMGDGAEIRRARIQVRGTLLRDWAYKLETNFDTDGTVELTDAWLGYQGLEPFHVTVGNQKVPFSQQSMTSSNWQVFQERALPDALIDSPGVGRRRLGITGGGYGEHWNVNLGFFGEGVDDAGSMDEQWGTAGRVVFAPIVGERRLLAFGGAVYYRRLRSDSGLDFATRPESNIAGTELVNTGTLDATDDLLTYNAQISAVWGSFHAQAEYIGNRVGRRNGLGTLGFGGWYVQAGYFLTGEAREYSMRSAKYGRVVPNSIFGDRSGGGFGWGAWELAARFSAIDLEDRDIRGGKERDVTVGLNWWVNPSIMFRLNYVHANADPNSAAAGLGGIDEKVNILEGRAQLVF